MKKAGAARKYARALIDVAVESNDAAQYGKELGSVVEAMAVSEELGKVLLNPMYTLEERHAVGDGLCDRLGLSNALKNFLRILIERRTVGLLSDISVAYSRFEDDIAGRVRAEVQAPTELTKVTLDDVREKLRAETGKDVILTFKQAPDLIGGFVVRMDNLILDGSIKAQLESMKEKLLEGAV
ncbi:ATP synthase delta chain [hydrothermal vent metagenome]|uniref:ATP synthase delta chain n=1 Tax=hydrothermal vent metagenome TaxID=652676 RepID=A0A3B0QNT7_9ZZZZ